MKKNKTLCKPAGPNKVVPVPGKITPAGAPLIMPEDGLAVDLSESYWRNRLRDGDIVRVAPVAKAKKKPAVSAGKDEG